MKTSKILIVLFVLSIGYNAFGQDECNYRGIITKIDSISKARNIETGKVKILFVSNSFDKTDTEQKNLTKVAPFSFDGRFLVIEDKYFNLDKLLYFYIKEGVFEFFFEGY